MSFVLKSNLGTVLPVFRNILLSVKANPVQMSLWRFYSAATTNSKERANIFCGDDPLQAADGFSQFTRKLIIAREPCFE